MKTVILCGGMGTRLKEETEYKPKPLVNVGPYPIIWHIMKTYSHQGYKEFVLPLGFKGEVIKDYFVNLNWKNNNFSLNLKNKDIRLHDMQNLEDWSIDFVDTGLETLTGARLYQIKHLLENEDDFFLTYGDGLADIDVNKLLEFHKKKGKIATITGINIDSRYGILDIDHKEETITHFSEKPKGQEYINGGFMVFSKRIFEHLKEDNVMFEKTLLPTLAEMGELAVFKHHGFWHCMDTHRDYLDLNELWKTNPKWKIWSDVSNSK